MLSLLHNISGLKVSKKKSCTLTRLTREGHPKLLLSPSSLLVISFYFIFNGGREESSNADRVSAGAGSSRGRRGRCLHGRERRLPTG